IGGTPENPFFDVNSPLVSRSQIFQFQPISEEDIRKLIDRAIHDPERGYGKLKIDIAPEAIQLWATMSDGDARRALMALEVAVLSQLSSAEHGPEARVTGDASRDTGLRPVQGQQVIRIDLDVAEQSM